MDIARTFEQDTNTLVERLYGKAVLYYRLITLHQPLQYPVADYVR